MAESSKCSGLPCLIRVTVAGSRTRRNNKTEKGHLFCSGWAWAFSAVDCLAGK